MRKWFLCAILTLLFCLPAMAEDTLHLYNWNNALSPATAKRFEQYCKCKLVQDYYGDNEEMLARLTAGATGYDIVFPTGFAVKTLIHQNKTQPLNKSFLPNWKNLDPAYLTLNLPFDPGNQVAAPTAVSITLLGYNATQLQKANLLRYTSSWALIFDPAILKKIKGKVTVLDNSRELLAAALLYLDKDPNSTHPSDWKAAKEVILKAKPYWAAFNNQSYIKALTVGNIWVAMGYSNDMFQAQQDARQSKRTFTLDYRMQKEGNILAVDSMVILKTAKRPDLALKFINFMLDGKNAAEISNLIGATNPVKAARTYFTPTTKANPVIVFNATKGNYVPLKEFDLNNRRALNRFWSEIKVAH